MAQYVIDWTAPLFQGSVPHLLAVLSLLLVVVVLRFVLVRAIANRESLPMDVRRRLIVQIRTLLGIVFVVGLIFIMANELRAFAVSLVAIAVAIVLATKELILCLSGTALRIGTNAFTIGDRIEINGVRGNVIDQTFLAIHSVSAEGGLTYPLLEEVEATVRLEAGARLG